MSYTVIGSARRRRVKFNCGRCSAALESPLAEAGQVFSCPTCGVEFTTPGVAELQAERSGPVHIPGPPRPSRFRCPSCQRVNVAGLFQGVHLCPPCAARLAAAYQQELCDVLASPQRSRATIDAVTAKYAGRIADRDVRRQVYGRAVTTAAEGNVTADVLATLVRTREYLGLNPEEVAHFDAELHRHGLIRQLEAGVLPTVTGGLPVPLQRGEVARFWFQGVQFHQQRVVAREYVGGSSGVSFRIAKGVYYRVGSHRGHSVSRTALVHVATGHLVMTSKRLIFSGGSAFSFAWPKVLNVTAYSDGFSVTKDSTAQNNKPFVFICADPELANMALSACINAA